MRQKVFIARELQDKLESISEVLAADLEGVPQEVLVGIIDKSKMETYGITLNQLYNAISSNNLIIPGGAQDTGQANLILKFQEFLKLQKMYTTFLSKSLAMQL